MDHNTDEPGAPVSSHPDATPDGVIWYQDESLFDVDGLDDIVDDGAGFDTHLSHPATSQTQPEGLAIHHDDAPEFWATDLAPIPDVDDNALPAGAIVVGANGLADAGERFRTHWSSLREAAPVSGQSASAVWATVSEPETVAIPTAIRLPSRRTGTEPVDPATPPVTDFTALAAAVAGIQHRDLSVAAAVEDAVDPVHVVEPAAEADPVADTSQWLLPDHHAPAAEEAKPRPPIPVAHREHDAERTVISAAPTAPSPSWKDKWGPGAVNPPFPGAEPLHRPLTHTSAALNVDPRTAPNHTADADPDAEIHTEPRQQVNPLTVRRLLLATLVAAAVVLLLLVSTKLFGGSTKSPQNTVTPSAVTAPAAPSSQPLTTQPSTSLVEFG